MQALHFKEDVLKFKADLEGSIPDTHKYPVGRVRLSKQMPRYCVSCGEGIDLFMKLWNLQKLEAEHGFKTG